MTKAEKTVDAKDFEKTKSNLFHWSLPFLALLFSCGKIATSDTAVICEKTWMARNLDVSAYRNGDPIPQVTSPEKWDKIKTGAYCYYNNDSAKYAAVYGKLYNWYAVNDPRGLAPAGWRIPSRTEFEDLRTCINSNGGSLKSTNPDFWMPPNAGATNSTGFDGRGGGSLSYGTFINLRISGSWWSSTPADSGAAVLYLFNGTGRMDIKDDKITVGHSVRCIKD